MKKPLLAVLTLTLLSGVTTTDRGNYLNPVTYAGTVYTYNGDTSYEI